MTNKAKLGIVALFSCCAMVGMGFASWTISQDPAGFSASVTGNVSAESVLSCSAAKIGELHYSSLGFTDGTAGSTPTFKTTFTVEYTITSGGYTGEATLTATMGFDPNAEENDLFAEGNNFLSATVDGATMPTASLSENNTFVVTAAVNFSDVTTQTVTISYTIDFGNDDTAAANYQDYFYSIFEKNTGADTDVAFTFNATLKGGETA